MKTVVAGILAGSVIAASIGGAAADPWRYRSYPPPPPPPQFTARDAAGAIVAGAFLGYALGALLAPRAPVVVYPPPPYPPPAPAYYPPYYGPFDPHVAWCTNTYGPAYDITTDSIVGPYGVPYRCVSPGAAG
jgi:hypothetical protein